MSELKTKVNDGSIQDFLNTVDDEQKRADCIEILNLMQKATGETPKMWGASMIGFGTYHYKSKSGQEGDWFLIGFSPRKQNLSLHIMTGFENYPELMAKLGKYKTGKGCLYIKQLSDVDKAVLEQLVRESVARMRTMH